MRAATKLIVFFFCSMATLSAQHRDLVRGKITAKGDPVAGITVMNLVTEVVVQSDAQGGFAIEVAEDDLLIFSHPQYYYHRKLIYAQDFGRTLEIVLEAKIEMLDEVVVTYDISPEDLGIVPKGQRKYTVAERRLKTASDLDLVIYTGTRAGVGMGLDPLFNAISGRTKELRKNLEVERKNMRLQQLRAMFEQDYYTNRLGIGAEHIGAFEYYLVENPEFIAKFDRKNKARTQFVMTRLAFDFRELLNAASK